MMAKRETSYPPLDTPKPVAGDVWIVDSAPPPSGPPLPLRMTVIRLPGGELLLHSPTRFTADLRAELEQLGPIRHLVAPSFAHWLYVPSWQSRCPGALTWAAPGLAERRPVRRAGLAVDRVLYGVPPKEWGDAIETIVVPGVAGFHEVALHHRPSGTLVLTDLIVNLETHRLSPPMRWMTRLAGSAAPAGRAPIYLRAVLGLARPRSTYAARRLLDLRPARVIFAHGAWFEHDGTEALQRSLGWLAGGGRREAPE